MSIKIENMLCLKSQVHEIPSKAGEYQEWSLYFIKDMYNLWLYLCQNNVQYRLTVYLCVKEYLNCVLSLYSVAQIRPNKPFIRKICMATK